MRVVVPYSGSRAKTRLELSASAREELSHAMLADVVAAAVDFGRTWVVTPDQATAEEVGANWIADPGGGQGVAVEAALRQIGAGPVLVVNSDLPSLKAGDLRALAAATPEPGIAIAAAADATTNALGLSDTALFAPLYGAGSCARFIAHAARTGLTAVAVVRPGLRHDVDTLADLERLTARCGPNTQAALASQAIGA